ncbi:MAG: hypothetical protein SGBAC_007345 [Bacillariaceae sp.]
MPPAVKDKHASRTTTTQNVRHNAEPVNKQRATERDTRRSSSFLQQAVREQSESSPRRSTLKSFQSSVTSVVKNAVGHMLGTKTTKRSPPCNSETTTPLSKKQKRTNRTAQHDSLATPQAPHVYVGEKRKRKSLPKSPPQPSNQIIELVGSDFDTEDESTPAKRPQQTGNTQSNRNSSLFSEVMTNGASNRPAKQTSVYDICDKVEQEVKEAVPDTPSDAKEDKIPTPTKHSIHSDVDSSCSDDEEDAAQKHSTKQQQHLKGLKAVIPKFDAAVASTLNSAGTDGEEAGNQTQEDSESDDGDFFSSFLPKGLPRRSKPTAKLQAAQNAAKTRKNADMEDMNNFQTRKKSLAPREGESSGIQPIVLGVDDNDDDENDGHSQVLSHPGRYADMQMYGPEEQASASLGLPDDLAVAGGSSSGTNVSVLLKGFDQETRQWKNGAQTSSRQHDSDDVDDFWADHATKEPKNTKVEAYSPEDGKASRRARKMAEVVIDRDDTVSRSTLKIAAEDVTDNEIDNVNPIRQLTKNHLLRNAGLRKTGVKVGLLNLTKVNGRRGIPRKGTRVVAGASTAAEASSQETTSSQESREFSDKAFRNGRRSNRYGTRSNSQDEHPDFAFAKNLQDQEMLLRDSRRELQRSAKKKKRPATNEDEPIVLSSDSEQEEKEELPDIKYNLFRIALGKRVYNTGCALTFSPRENKLTLEGCKSWRKTQSSNFETERAYFELNRDTLKLFKFYKKKESDDNEPLDNSADFSFVAIQIMPLERSNNLGKFPNCYKPHNEGAPTKSRYITLQFRADGEFEDFRTKMNDHLEGIYKTADIKKDETWKFAETLMEDSRRMATSLRAMEHQSTFIKGRGDEEVLLVYPFAGDPAEIEAAANGLQEPSGKLKTNRGYISDNSESDDEEDTAKLQRAPTVAGKAAGSNDEAVAKVKVRQHYVTLRVKDYERLQPEEWLNDSLVDFWMQWISRREDKSDTNLHFFTSHFYSALAKGGPESVTSWTAKKNINIFEKKFIFIPINKDLHWSLCVVVNPGCIMNSYEQSLNEQSKLDVPCLIFMDSLKMHRKITIRKKIENWLNSEWSRINPTDLPTNLPNPFTKEKFRMFTPTGKKDADLVGLPYRSTEDKSHTIVSFIVAMFAAVPMQNNTWDCGVFVCRYALAICKLRNRKFTFRDVHSDSPFHRLVSGGAAFDFNMKDIVRFRGEFQKLIENLSGVWENWKREGEKKPNNRKSDDDDDEKTGEGGEEEEVNAATAHEEKSDEHEVVDGSLKADEVNVDESLKADEEVNDNRAVEADDDVHVLLVPSEEQETATCPPNNGGSPEIESMEIVGENESASLATDANESICHGFPTTVAPADDDDDVAYVDI